MMIKGNLRGDDILALSGLANNIHRSVQRYRTLAELAKRGQNWQSAQAGSTNTPLAFDVRKSRAGNGSFGKRDQWRTGRT